MSMSYTLAPFSIGEERYIVISKGHHDIHEFMRVVRQEVAASWPLGVPVHVWMKTVPARRGSGYSALYEPVAEGTSGAWPCTYVQEAFNEARYEVVHAERLQAGSTGTA